MKTCTKCKIEKNDNCFYTINNQCKSCLGIMRKAWKLKNKEKCKQTNKQYIIKNNKKIKEYKKQWYQDNKNKILEDRKKYYTANNKKIKKYIKQWQKNNNYNVEYKKINKEQLNKKRRIYENNKKKNDPIYKLRTNISRFISVILKNRKSSKNNQSILNHLPYSISELKEHLEKQFEPWMNWNNYGKYNVKTWDDNDPTTWTWQLDHIIPNKNFNYISMQDQSFQACWALSNLRPYSAKQNIRDGARRNGGFHV